MSRIREFSAERYHLDSGSLSRSKNSLLSSTNLQKNSSKKLQKHQFNTPKQNKINKEINTTSYVKISDSNKLSSSGVSNRSSRSEYLCVGCINHQMASDKKSQRQQEKMNEKKRELQNITLLKKQNLQNQLKNSRLMSEAAKVNQYNISKIKQKQSQRLKQLQRKHNQSDLQKKQQQDYLKHINKYQQQKQIQKQKFRSQIKKQIQEKQKRQRQDLLRDQREIKKIQNNNLQQELNYYQKERKNKQIQYRQDLLKQIKQRNYQNKNSANQKNQNMGIGIIEASYQRELERKRTNQQRKEALLQQAKRRKKQIQKQVYLDNIQQQRIQEMEMEERMRMQKEQQKYIIQKSKRMQDYVSELKYQIQSQKKKKQEERNEDLKILNNSMQLLRIKIQKKSCKSCEKNFPKTYLTKVK